MFAETIGKLDEVHLGVRDLDQMKEFYTNVLGFGVEFYHEGQMAGLQTPGAALVLNASKAASAGVTLVFSCEDIESSLKAVTEKGIQITEPVYEGHWGARIGWV